MDHVNGGRLAMTITDREPFGLTILADLAVLRHLEHSDHNSPMADPYRPTKCIMPMCGITSG